MGNSAQNGNLAWTGRGGSLWGGGRGSWENSPLCPGKPVPPAGREEDRQPSGRVQGRQMWGGPSSLPGDMEW